jgi:hypothetical protein
VYRPLVGTTTLLNVVLSSWAQAMSMTVWVGVFVPDEPGTWGNQPASVWNQSNPPGSESLPWKTRELPDATPGVVPPVPTGGGVFEASSAERGDWRRPAARAGSWGSRQRECRGGQGQDRQSGR